MPNHRLSIRIATTASFLVALAPIPAISDLILKVQPQALQIRLRPVRV